MACPLCEDFFTGDFLCVNVPDGGTLQYGVQLQGVPQAGPGPGQTSVFYRICNCNDVPGVGISHVNFQLCEGGALPVQALIGGTSLVIDPAGDAFFAVPNFKVEFGNIEVGAETCVTLQLVYNVSPELFAFFSGRFGVKVGGGGGAANETNAGFVDGLQIPCVEIPACTQDVTAEICAQATVTLTPRVQARQATVTCINGPVIDVACADINDFDPLPNTGSCTFDVAQVICVTVPLKFSAGVNAVPSGGACGDVVPGNVCPSNDVDG
ncbi:hypothetical protein [Jeotgalibacillus aurantiacus]|uniref:hypothetical protein n=1 Tax=Jeotgalibacillus aurantiacus TaxID=2763266 RepID=UPI001D0A5AA1|nr:hypothetical protein [Jeotgalibacillus aurantiacus]